MIASGGAEEDEAVVPSSIKSMAPTIDSSFWPFPTPVAFDESAAALAGTGGSGDSPSSLLKQEVRTLSHFSAGGGLFVVETLYHYITRTG